ncbi:MAG: hypothetical protein ACI4KF_05875 [Huintestinicola sp.]
MTTNILEYGPLYIAFIVLLALSVVMDAASITRSLKKGGSELTDYATYFIKYLKIAILFFAGAFCVYAAVMDFADSTTRLIHGILGILLLFDSIASIIIKMKYKRDKKK